VVYSAFGMEGRLVLVHLAIVPARAREYLLLFRMALLSSP